MFYSRGLILGDVKLHQCMAEKYHDSVSINTYDINQINIHQSFHTVDPCVNWERKLAIQKKKIYMNTGKKPDSALPVNFWKLYINI